LSLTGFLNNFSLAEILQIIDFGCKSGRLIIKPSSKTESTDFKNSYYLWFEHGKLVSITNNFSNTSLLSFIETQDLIDNSNLKDSIGHWCSRVEPVGSCLYRNGSLTKQQLQSVLQTQLEQVYQLFQVSFGWFKFEDVADENKMPWQEMTGETIEARQLVLNGLRKVTDWQHLESVLPAPNFLLEQLVTLHHFKLESLEFKLWKFADGKTSLDQFARAFNEPIEKIQKAAYRLIVVELIEAIPVFDTFRGATTNRGKVLPESDKLRSQNNPVQAEFPSQGKVPQNKTEFPLINNNTQASTSLVGNLIRFLGNF
jgi:hypothetical protein